MSRDSPPGWPSSRLGEHVDLLAGFAFKSARFTQDAEGIRLLRGDNIAQGRLRWNGARRWSSADRANFARYELARGDVVIAMDRPWIEAGLKCSVVRTEDVPSLLVQRVARLRAGELLDQRFLGAVIEAPAFTSYVRAVQTGTAVPHISATQIGDYPVRLPPLSEQRRISSVVEALDDRIDSNRRLAASLEDFAQVSFSHAFPQLWTESPDATSFSEVCDVLGGGTPRTSNERYWDGDVPWISVKDLHPGPYVLSTERTVTELALAESRLRTYPRDTVVISARGTVGLTALMGSAMAFNQSCFGLRGSKYVGQVTLLHIARSAVDLLRARAHGSVFASITRSTFESLRIRLPEQPAVTKYEEQAAPLYEAIRALMLEATTLQTVRDALLPKLVSGQIRVPNTADPEEVVGPVAEEVAA